MKQLAISLLVSITGACASSAPAPRCPSNEAPTPGSARATPAADQPAHAHDHGHPHGHAHSHPGEEPPAASQALAVAIPHAGVRSFENNGNTLRGVATASMGAKTFEVWQSSIAVGSRTPPHRHDVEEVFILLRGKLRAQIGDQVLDFEAPATLIAPANVQHQLFNTGQVPTEAIVVTHVGSQIWTPTGEEMTLPWRR
ncbi:cupin domain-containing protein [Sorangium sp. So ce185]|uniref:cupin domain-containing protein n=1 Tax=Sorangium sp. So ce185 TaxID=3133287 RepID=UPI003F5F8A0F